MDGEEALLGFEQLKNMVKTYHKLYFINSTYKIVPYTDASDYAHGTYSCQIKPAIDTYQIPLRTIQWRANKIVHYGEGSLRDILGAQEARRLTRRDRVHN